MNEEMIIENCMTRQGWRRLHFLARNEETLKEAKVKWLRSIPWESANSLHSTIYQEAGIWHCHLIWPVRGEVVKVEFTNEHELDNLEIAIPEDRKIILWTLVRKAERVSAAVEMAAWRYQAWFGLWPDTAWVGKRLDRYEGKNVDVEGAQVDLISADWMPELGIGAGRRINV